MAHHRAKLTAKQVRQIRRTYAAGIQNQTLLARIFGVSQATIHQIVHKATWRHVGIK